MFNEDSIKIGATKWQTYFLNVSKYSQKEKIPPGIEPLNDLYPPNFIILNHFLQRKDQYSNNKILDYGCGAGVMIVYMAKIGIDIYGYDNWSQISPKGPKHFLSKYGLENRIIDNIDDFEIVYHTGIWCKHKFRNLKKIISDPKYKKREY